MSSVLHPVGPEPPKTYWVRRSIVIASAIMVLAVIVALIVNSTSSGSAVQPTAPAPSPVAAETASPGSMGSELRTPTASAPSESATIQASSNPKAKASPAPKVTAKPGPVACPADQMRVTLNGKQHLLVKKSTVFQLSLINGSGQTCIASITPTNFELKIYSGTDRIWSTSDCSTAIKPMTRKLPPERVVEWSLAWNGRRSRDDCKKRPEIPLAGTYFATAQLEGAKPVQLRMILRG